MKTSLLALVSCDVARWSDTSLFSVSLCSCSAVFCSVWEVNTDDVVVVEHLMSFNVGQTNMLFLELLFLHSKHLVRCCCCFSGCFINWWSKLSPVSSLQWTHLYNFCVWRLLHKTLPWLETGQKLSLWWWFILKWSCDVWLFFVPSWQVIGEGIHLPHACARERDVISGHAPPPHPLLHPCCCGAELGDVSGRLHLPQRGQHQEAPAARCQSWRTPLELCR